MALTEQQLQEKLQTLRNEWVTARISRREIIVLQARALKNALAKLKEKNGKDYQNKLL